MSIALVLDGGLTTACNGRRFAPPLMLSVRRKSKRPRIALTAAKVDTPLQLSTVVRSRRLDHPLFRSVLPNQRR